MNTVSIVLTSLLTVTLVVLIAPSVLAMNRGRVLRNIALWLAIALGLALFYQTFGPFETARFARQTLQEPESEAESLPDPAFLPPE